MTSGTSSPAAWPSNCASTKPEAPSSHPHLSPVDASGMSLTLPDPSLTHPKGIFYNRAMTCLSLTPFSLTSDVRCDPLATHIPPPQLPPTLARLDRGGGLPRRPRSGWFCCGCEWSALAATTSAPFPLGATENTHLPPALHTCTHTHTHAYTHTSLVSALVFLTSVPELPPLFLSVPTLPLGPRCPCLEGF